ncbi:HYC_CC_PP family protein [Pareuzebyella sediminis]|uniref:HYC_CC_PP family protein n=1 Tax=Pareuzebyella sediminis TaxID=2607998 RepID=UPI001E2BDBB0|nr:hypothetical protein [Pareuzebyella sediminis]
MMKERLHRLFACFMAFLLLASTTSWTVGKHYCMGHLVDISFFAHADDCGMDKVVPENDSVTVESEDSCCSDEIISVAGQDNLKNSFDQFSSDQQWILISFVYSYTYPLFYGFEKNTVLGRYYSPPPLIRDLQILDQTFLI